MIPPPPPPIIAFRPSDAPKPAEDPLLCYSSVLIITVNADTNTFTARVIVGKGCEVRNLRRRFPSAPMKKKSQPRPPDKAPAGSVSVAEEERETSARV